MPEDILPIEPLDPDNLDDVFFDNADDGIDDNDEHRPVINPLPNPIGDRRRRKRVEDYYINLSSISYPVNRTDLISYLESLNEILKDQYFVNTKEFINHTRLVDFETNGPRALVDETKKDSPAINFGKLVDCILLTPEEFPNSYTVINEEDKLTPSLKAFADVLKAKEVHNLSSVFESVILEIAKEANVYQSFSDKTIIEKISKYKNGILKYIRSRGELITIDDYNKALSVVDAIRTSKITSKIFNNSDFKIFYQVPIFCYELHTKVLFDMIVIDTKNNVIIPIDLKTIQNKKINFVENSFYKFKYYRQAEMYIATLKEMLPVICNDSEKYRVDHFKFLVASAEDTMPLIYEFPVLYDDNDKLIISKNGATVENFKTVIEDIFWHYDHCEYSYNKDLINKFYSNENTNNITNISIL